MGLAIRPARHKTGVPYYKVPRSIQNHKQGDLSRFIGWVAVNRPADGILVVQVTQFGPNQRTIVSVPMQVDLPYSAIRRARLYSAHSIDPGPEVTGDRGTKTTRRPGSIAGFDGTRHRAYRTTEEILLR